MATPSGPPLETAPVPDVDRPAALVDRVARARLVGLALVAVGTAALAQQAWLVWRVARRYVSEDQALLWAAARSLGTGQVRQPNFWGQAYGVTFEAVPAELFRWIGIGYPTGLPLGIALLNLAAWWLPGIAAHRAGRPVLALLALGAPVLLSTEHALLLTVYNTALGRTLAGAAAALAIVRPARRSTVALVLGLGGMAVAFDASAALVVAPVLVGLLAHRRSWGPPRGVAGAVAVGLAAPVAWRLLERWWYDRHPDDALHPAPELRPAWSVLTDNLGNPTRHFAVLALEVLRSPVVVVAAIVVLVVVIVRRRDRTAVAALAVLLAVTALALALPRSRDGMPTVYYPPARTLLSLPLGLWVVASLVRTRPAGARRGGVGPALVVAAVVVSGGVRLATHSTRLDRIEGDAVAFGNYPLTPAPELVGLCDRAGEAARSRSIPFVLFELRTPAYACAGVFGDEPATVYPPYERRAWVLRAADVPGPAELLVVGAPPVCPPELRCEALDPDLTVVTLGGLSPLEAARRLGVEVRGFEPGGS